jgi:hypothetical protein
MSQEFQNRQRGAAQSQQFQNLDRSGGLGVAKVDASAGVVAAAFAGLVADANEALDRAIKKD